MRLPVRAPEEIGQELPDAGVDGRPLATQTIAIPVHQAPEPGARMQPSPRPAGASALAPSEDGDVWHAAVQRLVQEGAISALTRELALQSQLVARDGEHWLLRIERESLNQPTAHERLRAALEAAGCARQISVEVGRVSDSPALRNAHAAEERQKRAVALVHADPYVQQLMRDFDARIVPGSIRPEP